MLELLVAYIEEKGYRVQVCPRYLVIWRKRTRHLIPCNIFWYIPRKDLIYAYKEGLFMVADHKMYLLEKAEKEGPPAYMLSPSPTV